MRYRPQRGMEQQTIPMSEEDGKRAAYRDAEKAFYGSPPRPSTRIEHRPDPNNMAATLQVIDKIRASIMDQSVAPQTPATSHTAYSARPGSVRPTSPTIPMAYTNPQAPPPLSAHFGKQSFVGERDVRFPDNLPVREPSQNFWRKSLNAMDNPNRRSSGMLFGPGGPATGLDPIFPNRPTNEKSKECDPAMRDYLYRLARALMLYGAPGHRLERYLVMTAQAMSAEVEFVYQPDHLTVYFDDARNHTGHTRVIKGAGTDLGRWLDAHNVSKHVINDRMSIEEGIYELDEIAKRKPAHSDWFLFFIYGLAGIGIAPFAYGARFVDLPICFMLSAMLGVMQLKLVPRNHLYSVLFEVSAAVVFSFLGRMIGSVKNPQGDRVFCYGAISEASINLLQPGYWITNAVLELMNRQISASGSRLMYALVYAVMLAYGVTIGSSLYGLIDHDAVASTVCEDQLSPLWNLFFVPFFSAQVGILGGAKYSQLPAMVFITFCMYSAFLFSSRQLQGSFTVGATAGGITMGLLGNSYARMGRKIETFFENLWTRARSRNTEANESSNQSYTSDPEHTAPASTAGSARTLFSEHIGYTCAAASMVPAMIVLVPSGLANRGSHLAGILAAEAIVRNSTEVITFPQVGAEVFTAAFPIYLNVVQHSISLAVGLSIGALAVYPFGKSRSWVMSW